MQSLGEHRRARVLLARARMQTGLWIVVAIGTIITISLSYVLASRFPRVQDFMTALVAEEHLLVSKALPIFRTPYYFCAYSDLSLLYEAYDFSSQSEV